MLDTAFGKFLHRGIGNMDGGDNKGGLHERN